MQEAKQRAGLETYQQQGRERITVECGNCGEQLERPPSEVEANEFCYCDRECFYEHYAERMAGEKNHQWNSQEVECATCGDTFYQDQHRIENRENLFCSRECYGKWRSENVVGEDHPRWTEYEQLTCEYCGKIYSVKPSEVERSRFCSVVCKMTLLRLGEHNPMWKGGPVEMECKNCGELFTCERKFVDTREYCSKECMHEMAHPTGEDHPRYKGDLPSDMSPDYLGPYWEKERLDAIIRDQARCRVCGITEPEHIERYGVGLHVHHIVGRREFVEDGEYNHSEANKLDNLRTLCAKHHAGR